MKKLINDPNAVVDEMLEGFCQAHADLVQRIDGTRAVAYRGAPENGKVGVVIGGGSGHEPAFLGYVGRGMATAGVAGSVFTSPPPDPILAATRAVNGGRGILYAYGNYAGDDLNFDTAAELAASEGIEVRTVRVTDDVASAPKGSEDERRGIAGGFFVYKIAGARAAEGGSLAEVEEAAAAANSCCRSMGVALSAATIPASGHPTFNLGPDEMEIGMGVHGEPGVRRGKLAPAGEVASALLEHIVSDMPLTPDDAVAVLVDGLGATPLMELYILYHTVADRLADRGVTIHRSYVGEYVTSLEMAGASLSVLKLDDELKRLLDAPAETAHFTQF